MVDMCDQYSHFCALGEEDYDQRLESARSDYSALCAIHGVIQIGINWPNRELMIGIGCVDVPTESGIRELGEYIIVYAHSPVRYRIVNVTRTVNGHPHPHVDDTNGIFCLNVGNQQIRLAMADRKYSFATAALVAALRMDRAQVDVLNPYGTASIEKWPLKSEVKK